MNPFAATSNFLTQHLPRPRHFYAARRRCQMFIRSMSAQDTSSYEGCSDNAVGPT